MTENSQVPPFLVGISVTECSTGVSEEPTQVLESPRSRLAPLEGGGKPNRFSQRRRAAGMYKPKVVTPTGANGFSSKDATEGFHQVKSHVSRIRVGFADTIGRRPTNEDQIVIIGEQHYDVVAVFDGHNGALVSGFISENLRRVMGDALEPAFPLAIEQCLNSTHNGDHSAHLASAEASANSAQRVAEEDTRASRATDANTDDADATAVAENDSTATAGAEPASDSSPHSNSAPTEAVAPNNDADAATGGEAVTPTQARPVATETDAPVPDSLEGTLNEIRVEEKVQSDQLENIEPYFGPIFHRLNELIRDECIVGGATALVLAFTDESIIVANAGDCRCVMGRGEVVKRLTTDHKPSEPREQARIEQQGGCVIVRHNDNGTTTARVNGVLSVARAMGDFELADYITCEPDVFRLHADELADNYFIVACDGLWDVVDDRVAIKTVTEWLESHADDVQGAAKKLVDIAYLSGSTDNISVVVVKK